MPTGSGFTGASSVSFHGTLASSFTVISGSQLTAVAPQGATSGPISVTTAGGTATSSGSFTVTTAAPPPPPTTTTTTAYYGGVAESVNGALSYLLSDPVLGSMSASVNTSGAVTATQLYSPYGGMRYQSGTLPTDYGFTHQRSDASTSGLDDYGARYYDPVAGQFTSADTVDAGGLNRYGYVGSNPETFIDPTGQYAQACDTAMCGPANSNGMPGGSVATAPAPETTGSIPADGPSSGGPSSGGVSAGSVAAFAVVGGLFLLGAGAVGYAASQGFWIAWHHEQAQQSGSGSSGLGLNVGAWVAHGVLPGIGSTRAGGGGSGSGSGRGSGGGADGAGVIKRLPPPTENGETSGFGAPILSDSVIPECDPQLAMEALCIGWTRTIVNPLVGAMARYSPKVHAQMTWPDSHGFPEVVDNYGAEGILFDVPGGDGIMRRHLIIPGTYEGKDGWFHYIWHTPSEINHRQFEPEERIRQKYGF